MKKIELSIFFKESKVPEATLLFWLIKMMSTTVGETAADFLNIDLNFGLAGTSIVTGALLIVALFVQIFASKYQPARYWISVVLISIFGTLVTDNLTDNFGIPLAWSSCVFLIALGTIFIAWYNREQTLAIQSIDSVPREIFYWTAILLTFALGTAVGDWIAEGFEMGYLNV